MASNSAGSATSNAATLSVSVTAIAPTITSQPANKSVAVGQTASFTVAASGNPTPTLQWQRSNNGGTTWADLAGATSATYTTAATVIGDNAAQFRAVASNSAGSATSNAATLTVTIASTITLAVTDPIIAEAATGGAAHTTTLTATRTGATTSALTLTLSDDAAALTTPATLTIAAGATTGTVTLTGSREVGATVIATITATGGAASVTATVHIADVDAANAVFTIDGTVQDNGAAKAGTTTRLRYLGANWKTATSAADGSFAFPGLVGSPTDYSVVVEAGP